MSIQPSKAPPYMKQVELQKYLEQELKNVTTKIKILEQMTKEFHDAFISPARNLTEEEKEDETLRLKVCFESLAKYETYLTIIKETIADIKISLQQWEPSLG